MAGNRRAKSFQCPNCGSPQEVVALGHTKTYACPACSAVIDMSKPEFEVVLKSQEVTRTPVISLGTRGILKDVLWEVIGYARKLDGTGEFSWSEYLLFNPYHGFRWLVESGGHWNFGTPIKEQPVLRRWMLSQSADLGAESYKRFLSGYAVVDFILGEFYWEARQGDKAEVADFIAPPLMLSMEKTDDEVSWSVLEYVDADVISKIFNKRLIQVGIAPNQPNKAKERLGSVFRLALIAFAILMAGEFLLGRIQRNDKVFEDRFTFFAPDAPSMAGKPPATNIRVIPEIELKGRTSNIEIETSAPVDNSWVFLDYDLVNLETGDNFGTGSEVSYYHGSDSDGAWTEGSRTASIIIPAVPPGKYSLTIEPELPAAGQVETLVRIKRDSPYYTNMVLALLSLWIYPIWLWLKSKSFETLRWQESDIGSAFGDSDE